MRRRKEDYIIEIEIKIRTIIRRNIMGAIISLITVAIFGTGLLIYFHIEDKKNEHIKMTGQR